MFAKDVQLENLFSRIVLVNIVSKARENVEAGNFYYS